MSFATPQMTKNFVDSINIFLLFYFLQDEIPSYVEHLIVFNLYSNPPYNHPYLFFKCQCIKYKQKFWQETKHLKQN